MFGDTPLWLIQDDATLAKAAELLGRAKVIGVDTESDSFHHYQEKVCLVQISDQENDYVVDPLAVPDLGPLAEVMANPDIVKVFHGADYDIVCLKRDFNFQIRNVFDTMIASQFLGLPRIGLADLIDRWFGHTVDKALQRHDWAQRPLRDEHLYYARGDSHFLPALRDVLTRRLQGVERLSQVLEECEVVEGREWQGRQHDPGDFWRVKGAKQLDERGLHVLRALYTYRDGEARHMDRPAFKVIPDPVLLDLAGNPPTDVDSLQGRLRRGSPLARRHTDGLHAAIAAGLADEEPIPEPVSKDGPNLPGLRGREAERLFLALKDWRNAEMNRTGLPPITVASNGQLREVTRVAPRTLEELATVPELRRWQVARYGPQLVDIVVKTVRNMPPEPEGARAAPKRRRRRRRAGELEGDAAEPSADGVDEG